MLSPILIYHLLVLAVLLSLLVMVVMNLLVLPDILKHRPGSGMNESPSVAILVPARNEEANIEACLRSLLSQDYANYEVWLYDDASTDRTCEIANRVAEEFSSRFKVQSSKLHVVEGSVEPPPGWLGKANACHQLYGAMRAQAEPDYVLFTDADVRFASSALGHTVAAAQARGAGLLSVFPRQVTLSWAERLAVPILLHWAVYTFLPLPLAFTRRTGPAFAAANGQFMLFRREAYEVCGGHTAVRSEILEDVALARAVKGAGYHVILADGGLLIQTRMYSGHVEVWRGYSKNAYAFFGYSPFFLAVGIAVLGVLYIAPIAFTFYAILSNQQSAFLWLPIGQYGVAVLSRMLLAMRFKYRLGDSLLHPMAVAFLIAICINSMWWSLTGRGGWKGRAASKPSSAPQS